MLDYDEIFDKIRVRLGRGTRSHWFLKNIDKHYVRQFNSNGYKNLDKINGFKQYYFIVLVKSF